MRLARNVRDIAGKVGEKISEIFDTTTLRDIAGKTGFIKRNTDYTGFWGGGRNPPIEAEIIRFCN